MGKRGCSEKGKKVEEGRTRGKKEPSIVAGFFPSSSFFPHQPEAKRRVRGIE
uniref:Uncharacterized protein n=1 Tax=Cucumis melo TaxID=3656 RepID=A0A9I9D731_CUCME